jgi:hypothetical protein
MYLARNNQLPIFVISEYANHNDDNTEKLGVKVCPTKSNTTPHWKYVNTIYLRVIITNRKHTFRRVRKIAKRDSYLRHVCPSVRMELGSH